MTLFEEPRKDKSKAGVVLWKREIKLALMGPVVNLALARGKLHIVGGAPQTGKTTIALSYAAIVSSGATWPDNTQAAIGDAEHVHDTTNMSVTKQRDDVFRHWVLGLGSGDLIVRTSGAQAHQFDLPNVLSLGRRVREIEELLRMKQVVNPVGPT